jgi:hypothetical protein
LRVKLTIILGTALTSSAALAAWTDFAPRPFENGAYFELFGSEERDESQDNGRQSGWSDTFFTEKINLFSNGYFYHPRFLQYQLSVSLALKQENYGQSFTPSTGWTRGTGFDYDGRLFFLPEHPYNFELFALRREPLYKEQSQTQHSTVETLYGARFQYRRKPYFVHAGYLDNQTSSQTDDSNVQRLNLDGEYFKEFGGGNMFTATAFFTPSRFSGSLGLTGDASQYGVTGLVDVQTVRLNVTASKSTYDQESPLSGQLANEQFVFQERLSAYLPMNFRADFYYRILNNTSTISERGVPGPRDLSDDSEDLEAVISHRLYQSLDSRYVFLRASRTSSGGDSTSVSNSLGVDYTKLIPRGRVMAGLNLATILTDSSGQTDIPSEPHPGINVQPPGVFSLDQLNVEQASLAVFVRSTVSPFELIRLASTDYTVTLIANRLEISVFLLPPGFVVPGTYDFVVSYSLTTGTFEQRMNTYGFNTSVQLLDNMLTPYYSFLAVRSTILAGVFPGVPLDSTRNTVGLNFLDGPWRAMGEFQSLAWDVNPYRQWRAEVQYTGSIDPTLRLYATADYLYRYHSEGTSVDTPTAYSEQNISLSGSVQKDFLSRALMLSAGGSYTRVLGLVDSNAYALNSALTYRIGKLELSAGIDAHGSDTQGTTGGPYNRTHQYYYVKVLRRIF